MASKKDFKQLRERLRKAGYTVELAKNGHWNVKRPDGKRIQICSTPSDHRSFPNTVQNLRTYLGYDDRAEKSRSNRATSG